MLLLVIVSLIVMLPVPPIVIVVAPRASVFPLSVVSAVLLLVKVNVPEVNAPLNVNAPPTPSVLLAARETALLSV